MRTPEDAHRSLARFVSDVLEAQFPGDWDVQWTTESGNFQRPAATVLDASPGDVTGDVRVMEKIQSYAVNVFPVAAESAYEGKVAAERICAALEAALAGEFGGSRPWLIPLFDYEGVSPDASTDQRTAKDWLKVRDLSVRAVQSPSDETLWTANAEVRLGWRRNALLPSSERPVLDVQIEQTGS